MNEKQKATYEALMKSGWELVWEVFKGNSVLMKKTTDDFVLFATITENGDLNFNRDYNA